MTAKEIIERCDELRPNGFSENAKISWIADIEDRIKSELQPYCKEVLSFPFLDEKDENAKLYADGASAELYTLYLCSMIDFYNSETARYNNDSIRFNAVYDEFLRIQKSTLTPKGGIKLKFRNGVTGDAS